VSRKAKVTTKDDQIRVRVTRAEKALFVRAAQRAHLSVSRWLVLAGVKFSEAS
jgi:uncharacterized protein (DUF1778 family)